MQEMEVSKTRAFKLGILNETREARKLDLLENAAIVSRKIEEKKHDLKSVMTAAKLEKKHRDQLQTVEIERIKDIVEWKKRDNYQKTMIVKEREALESIRLKKMDSEKEYREILRRNREEARMKYLEERQRYSENKGAIDAARDAAELDARRKQWRNEVNEIHAFTRNGVFHADNREGKIGYYKDIHFTPPDWIQYEDQEGNIYFYDPILKVTRYDPPAHANFHHHSVDDRIEYDAIHGEGSYDEVVYNAAKIQSVNTLGGYYDREGQWASVNGFYDEEETFWDLDKGYFDENNFGKWTLYPEVDGNLDFMV